MRTEFDEYLHESEPQQKQRAESWQMAIGLQAVDGLKPSAYLLETARHHIEGELSIDEVKSLLAGYYKRKIDRTQADDDSEEADKVSANIAKLLNERTFTFSPAGYSAIHRRIFEGVFDFAGKFRDYNFTKKEWVLRGDTVLYASAEELTQTLDYDFKQEATFSYQGLDTEAMIVHFAKFISGLWQIHPFGEGNTRTTAVFCIKYLRSMGFEVENALFANKAWYFRNALVRANYRNYKQSISPQLHYLECFFKNLLLHTNYELKNRLLLIDAPNAWDPSLCKHPTSTLQAPYKLTPPNPEVARLIQVMGLELLSARALLARVGLRDRANFRAHYLTPAIVAGFVDLLYPDSPQHPRQMYRLSPKGKQLFQSLSDTEISL